MQVRRIFAPLWKVSWRAFRDRAGLLCIKPDSSVFKLRAHSAGLHRWDRTSRSGSALTSNRVFLGAGALTYCSASFSSLEPLSSLTHIHTLSHSILTHIFIFSHIFTCIHAVTHILTHWLAYTLIINILICVHSHVYTLTHFIHIYSHTCIQADTHTLIHMCSHVHTFHICMWEVLGQAG